jgi:signal transduction histidine kinase/DNA-binding response OmpR family regulator
MDTDTDTDKSIIIAERRAAILDALNRAAMTFLSNIGKDFGEMMTAGLSPIAEVLTLDRLSVWRNFAAPDGTLHTSQIYRWDKRLGGTTEPTQELKNVTYAAFAPRWEALLQKGESINSPVSLLPEAEMLKSFGVVSAYVTPIFVSGKFWGFVLFEDRRHERYFESDSIETMRSATFLCANAVTHTEMERNIKAALDRATAASEAKGSFLSNMSHEMRTPLNTIIGMASIGKNAPDLERKDYALGKIEEASAHLLGVINDVLDMSKIEAGKLELVPVEFSFEKMLKKAVNAVCFRMEQKQQSFRVTIDGRIPQAIISDDQRLAQIIINLLSNAVKFTPEGGAIGLSAALEREGGSGTCAISIEVSDTGIGISPEQQERLFNAFEQADGGISRKFGGTGLGLVISKRIVEMMGGEISVASKEGAGSVFRFTFDAVKGKDAPKMMLDPSVNWETMKVMAVDDAEDTQSYFAEIFKRYGVSCDVVRSGSDALRRIEESGGYDIYFVDWKMPGMDGIELTREIRKRNADRKSVVIMISATEWALIRDDAEGAGVDRHLMKPLFASDIMDCMNTCLGVGGSSTPQQKKAVKGGELKGCHILLAEDVEINREILIASIEDTEVSIDCAENGLQAVRMLSENPNKYDLIFMDVQMPEMDGLEATRKIRESGSKIPIIAMTANVFKEDIEKCIAAGMDDHLGKPLDITNVITKVRKYWTRKPNR